MKSGRITIRTKKNHYLINCKNRKMDWFWKRKM